MKALDRILMPEEKRILELKYSGKRFSQMQGAELQSTAKQTLLRIHVIAGWVMPPDELVLILIDEFTKKITESYGNVTMDEVCFAFREKSHSVKEWGKALNISLIDEVMIPYLEKRIEVSKIEEQKKEIDYKPDTAQIDKEYQDFLNSDLGKKMEKENLLPKFK